MVDVAPFKAHRWNVKMKGRDISRNICPPYDVISAGQRKLIEKKSLKKKDLRKTFSKKKTL